MKQVAGRGDPVTQVDYWIATAGYTASQRQEVSLLRGPAGLSNSAAMERRHWIASSAALPRKDGGAGLPRRPAPPRNDGKGGSGWIATAVCNRLAKTGK